MGGNIIWLDLDFIFFVLRAALYIGASVFFLIRAIESEINDKFAESIVYTLLTIFGILLIYFRLFYPFLK